ATTSRPGRPKSPRCVTSIGSSGLHAINAVVHRRNSAALCGSHSQRYIACMIHICSLSRLHRTVATTGARHLVTLLRDTDLVQRPQGVNAADHLILGMDDITAPRDGYVAPADEHLSRLIAFVRGWDRAAPLVVHCYAGISRSTAGAYVTACALNPHRNELAIAQALRRASA